MVPAADRQWIMWNCNLPWTSRTKLDTQYLRCRSVARGKHQTGSCLGFDMTNIWHWIFGEADARHPSWIRERFGKYHDDSVVGHVFGSGLIKLFCLFRVFPRDFFHSFLRISIGFIHGLCVRETQEIHNRTIVRGICEAIPDLWTISKIFCEIC